MTCISEDRTDLIDEVDELASQARAVVLGLSFALNAEEGEPAREVVQGMLSSVVGLLNSMIEAMADLAVATQ